MTKKEKLQRLEGYIKDYENANTLDSEDVILFGKCTGYILCLFDNGDLTANEYLTYIRRL